MPGKEPLKKSRHPGVYLAGDRIVIRWTVQERGRREDRLEYMPTGATLADAVTLREKRTSESRKGARPSGPPTVGAYVQSWLARKAPGMKPAAAEGYAQSLEDRILPVIVTPDGRALGDLRLDEVTREHVEAWVIAAEGATRPASRAPDAAMVPCSRDTLLGWWSKVRQVLRDAAAEHALPDPTLRVRGPRAYGRTPVKERRTLTPDEVRRLLEEVGDSWRAEVFTAAMTGMRPGELYALTWAEVDLDRGRILVRASHHQGRVGTTKTGKVREVPIGGELAKVLRAHRQRQVREQHPALKTGLVFPATEEGERTTPDGEAASKGWHRGPDATRTHLARASRRAGLPIAVTMQVLRRTANTLLVGEGVDRLVVRAIIGHTTEAMTAHYYGAPEAEKASAAASLERLLRGT
jgi:integrase